MKKYLIRILLFFSIVAMADLCFGLTCGWLQDHAIGGRMKSVRQSALFQTADIVIMGSSRAHHHYVSSVLSEATEMNVYNAGVDGNGIVTALGLYELMEERYSPRIIIYDVEPTFDINVYAEDGNNTRYLGWLRPYYFKNPKVKEIICRVDPIERVKNLSALFRYNGKIVDLLKDQVVVSDYTTDGYAPLQGEMKTEPLRKENNVAPERDTLKLQLIEEFISRLSNSETRLIMIASPKYGAISSEGFSPVKDLCNKYQVDFWDFYCDSEFQKKEYFKESMHMNDFGARVFSLRIGKEVNELLEENE